MPRVFRARSVPIGSGSHPHHDTVLIPHPARRRPQALTSRPREAVAIQEVL